MPQSPARPRPRYAYLGPEGTFTEEALLQIASPSEADFLPQIDVVSAIESVRDGRADYAVVAIENSVEGGVTAVLDTLVAGSPLVITHEMLVSVSFVLAATSSCALSEIKRVAAHPHAWAQCRQWFNKRIPAAGHVPATSNTAPAAAMAAWLRERDGQEGQSGSPAPLPFDAALVPPAAVARYGLSPLVTGVADNERAVTRFVLIEKPGHLPAPTGADKTTLMVNLREERAGALLEMLEQFSARGVNLTRIESRPAGDAMGRYAFSIDAEGHIADERMAEVFIGLHRISPHVLFLGSYPRASGIAPVIHAGTTDEDFRTAKSWVRSLQLGETT